MANRHIINEANVSEYRVYNDNELEKTFFDTFGIRAYYKYLLIDKTSRCHNEKLFDKTNFIDFIKSGKDYLFLKVIKYPPQITDRILLELIRLGLNYDFVIHSKSKGELKEKLLILLIRNDVEFKHQVRALFKEKN